MSEPSATQREAETCTFSSENLDVSERVLRRFDISEWNCSRPADDGERCIWHADTTEKTQEALASEIGEGDLYGAQVADTDLSGLSFPDATGFTDADLTDANLNRADLTDADLNRADLTDADLNRADLTDADLNRADLTDASLRYADLTDASLRYADLTDADLNRADLTDADLRGADLTDASLRGADLTGADLNRADLTDASLRYADLTDADLRYADLTDASLRGADLTGADLYEADLTGADLYEADLTDANLNRADLTDASLRGADLTDANLNRADLTEAILVKADLTDADLLQADLTDANLNRADLTDADLNRADLTDADLFGADLTDANLPDADLTDATIQEATVRFTNCARATALRTDFTDANLTRANFEHAILRDSFFDGVSLYGARLYDTKLRGLSINDQTTFSDQTVYDREADPCDKWHPIDRPPATPTELEDTDLENKFRFSLAVKTGQALKSRLQSQTSSSVALEDKIKQELTRFERHSELPLDRRRQIGDSLEKAISVYRTRQRLQRENSRPEDIPQPYVNEKHCRRRHAFVTGSYWDWMKYSGLRWVMCYGESPARVVGTSVVVISVFTIVYSLLGGVQISGSEADFIGNLYFSSITFSTLGYAGIEPVKTSTQLLASIQSLIGGILIALLVAVFGRRALR